LGTLLPGNENVNRTVEIEAFTQMDGGLTFSNSDKLVGVQNLTLDLGGQTKVGPISIDDIVAAAINNNNEFGELVINSLLATGEDHYLMPEEWEAGVNTLPTGNNVLGNISSGPTRGELARVTINATDVGVNTGTITFSDDGGATPGDVADDDPLAELTVTGSKNITVASVDTTDVDITGITVDATGFTGTLTAPGASPAFLLDNTQTLTFTNGDDKAGTIALGNASPLNAGVVGNELSFIDATHFDGTLNLGVVSQVDSTNDDLNGDGDVLDPGENIAFTFTSGQGLTTATLAAANSKAPSLNAGSEWSFTYTGAAAGSFLKLTPTATLAAGSTLRLKDVPLVIDGAVPLNQLVDNPATPGVEGLIVTGGSIQILAGSSLTLTVGQVKTLEAAGVVVWGEGTVKVVGDASNIAFGLNLKSVGVDISGVTLIASPAAGFDTDATVELNLIGADNDGKPATADVAQTVVGSPNKDAVTTINPANDNISGGAANDTLKAGPGNDTLTGGAGDDTLEGEAGNDTYDVDQGSDTVKGLATGDVLKVATGATATAAGVTGFVATAATSNSGTATLTAVTGGATTIDVSAAAGTNGFTLNGGAGAGDGNDTLIGSNQADIINGGNDKQVGTFDTLTGKAGNDKFVFDKKISAPTAPTQKTVTAGVDEEKITTVADAVDNGNESITVVYAVNGSAGAVVVDDTPPVDVTSANAVASAIQAGLDPITGLTATVATNVVTITGDQGNSVNLLGGSATIGGTATTLAANYSNGSDVAQVSELQFNGTVVLNEVYSAKVVLAEGLVREASYTAGVGDGLSQVAAGLAAAFNAVDAGVNVLASSAGATLTFKDQNADNGGFVLSHTEKGALEGTGASEKGAANLAFADVITDFLSGADTISFGLVAGTAANYKEAAEVADYATALANANTAFDSTVQYYLTSSAAAGEEGLLFVDVDLDGTADSVVHLVGITQANFAATDIVA
jgi:hypothetical protein